MLDILFMDLDETFPLKFVINLGRREDRRSTSACEFRRHGLKVERFPAYDARWVRNARGCKSKGAYALGLAVREIMWRAKKLAVPGVLIFEDDVVLHPEFSERITGLEKPGYWGVLYFGTRHRQRPEVVMPGWVKPRATWGAHAIGVHRDFFELFARTCSGRRGDRRRPAMPIDDALSALRGHMPAYAVWPNIAWQGPGVSDLAGVNRKPFDEFGRQSDYLAAVEGVDDEMNTRFGRQQRIVG
jgi:GR25 family glycosyltransferase involved in LPS biosynthesis